MATATKHGLGRGLGALIPTKPLQEGQPAHGVRLVPVGHIEPNPRQPRKRFSPDALEELAASIREHGLIQPLLLHEVTTPNGTRYELIAGERRWRAAQRAGLPTVPAMIKGVTPQQALELALVENVQRADLNVLEEAEAYRQLVQDFQLTQEQVALRVGKKRTTISNVLRLLTLPEEMKTAVLNQELSEGHARALLQITNPKHQKTLMARVLKHRLSVRETEDLVRRELLKENARLAPTAAPAGAAPFRARPPSDVRRQLHTENQVLEEDLRRALGTQVKLRRSAHGGKITIEFYSDEELDVIYKKLMGQV